MKYLRIETAKNGYVVNEDNPGDPRMRPWDPYVFESFAALTKWLRKNLEDPNQSPKPPKPKA